MEAKFALIGLLSIILPSPSTQVAPVCPLGYEIENILAVLEISENTYYAAVPFSGSDPVQPLEKFNTQIKNIFSDVVSANSSSQVTVGFFSDTINFQMGNYVSSFQAAATDFLSTPLVGGASLTKGLTDIQTWVNQNGRSPTRVNMPVIYSSQIDNANINTIRNLIANMETQNYFITLYAIGAATTDRYLTDLRSALNVAGARQIHFTIGAEDDIPDLAQLIVPQVIRCRTTPVAVTTTTTTTTTTRPPTSGESRCKECLAREGSPLIYHPTRCDMFIHCFERADGQVVSIEKYCPHGTLFDQSLHACSHSYDVLKKDVAETQCRWCQNGNDLHPYHDSCVAYYQCATDRSDIAAKCCPTGQHFDKTLSQCVTTTSSVQCDRNRMHPHASFCASYYQCTGTTDLSKRCCPSGQGFRHDKRTCENTPTCPIGGCDEPHDWGCIHVAVSQCSFKPINESDDKAQRCADGTYFNNVTCKCENDNDALIQACRDEMTRDATGVCDPDVVIDLNPDQRSIWGFAEASEHRYWVSLFGPPSIDANQGVLNLDGNGDYAAINYYANNDFNYNTYFFRVHVKDDVSNGPLNKNMVILSNHPCSLDSPAGDRASVYITMNPLTRQVVYGIRTPDGEKTITLDYPQTAANENAWKEVTLRYDRDAGLMEANLRLYSTTDRVSGTQTTLSQTSDSTAQTGEILRSSCSIRIGKGADNLSEFQGSVDDVIFYEDCTDNPPTPAVDSS